MGMFDSLLTAIAPERAVKRAAAQSAIRAINSGYSNYGASLHKKSMRGWTWHGGSPKEDIEDNLRVLRERSRDAFMGVPLATGAIKTMRTNVVCGGLTPTPQIDNAFLGISDEEAQKINAQIAREFGLWANKPTCDADRLDNFYMLQQLVFTGFLLNGDAVAVLQNKKSPGVPYDLRLRIIEADRLCSPSFTVAMLKRSCKVLKPMRREWSLPTGFATVTRWQARRRLVLQHHTGREWKPTAQRPGGKTSCV